MPSTCTDSSLVVSKGGVDQGRSGEWTCRGALRGRKGCTSGGDRSGGEQREASSGKLNESREEMGEKDGAGGVTVEGGESLSFIGNILRQTAVASVDQEQQVEKPPLNLLTTTPLNYNRFVRTSGPLFVFTTAIEDLLAWKSINNSLWCLFLYIMLCYYPHLLPFVPFGCVAFVAAKNFYRKEKDIVAEKKRWKLMSATQDYDLRYNLHHIQNSTGQLCDMLEKASSFYESTLCWRDSELTWNFVQDGFLASLAASLILYFVPLHLIFLVLGIGAFTFNTPIFRALVSTGLECLRQLLLTVKGHSQAMVASVGRMGGRVRRCLEMVIGPASQRVARTGGSNEAGYGDTTSSSETSSRPCVKITFETYENQRYWIGRGWTDNLIPTERTPFSDRKGLQRLPKDSFGLPNAQWEWDGPWVISGQQEEEEEDGRDRYDEDGWEYGDSLWRGFNQRPGLLTYTRRRRWIRTMKCFDIKTK
eukprot:Nk52_evm6s380 gene=Nk52_evmTU6s380